VATDIHAEHVGSMLRQPWLLAAWAGHQRGELSEAGLREAEDRAAAENIALQREAGIEVFTDGEVRRTNWMTGILESTGGMSGFASTSAGNVLTVDEEKRKLELVVDTAQKVWG
jgi:5-methyltetrahydropteroyltriglutamate--homocysteine methyltransferase